jgi:hypothetical protein
VKGRAHGLGIQACAHACLGIEDKA